MIEPGSVVRTDDWKGYTRLPTLGYKREVLPFMELKLPHLVASLLKRWLLGTYQGAVRPTYLAYYLDEFTFRFNRRASRQRGKLFYRLVQQALMVDPVPENELKAEIPSEEAVEEDSGGFGRQSDELDQRLKPTGNKAKYSSELSEPE